MNSDFPQFPEDPDREVQWQDAYEAHRRLIAELGQKDYGVSTAHSCRILGVVLRDLLQAVGCRMDDPAEAAEKIAVSLYEGIVVLEEHALAAADGEELDEEKPVHPFLAPTFNMVAGIVNLLNAGPDPDDYEVAREQYLKALADQTADDVDPELN